MESKNSRIWTNSLFSLIFLVLVVICPFSSVQSVKQTQEELNNKLKHIRDYLNKINKPPVKTIQSPDGDIIDCVLIHQQPAFDHPQLKEHKLIIHVVGIVRGQHYGAEAIINLWCPKVENKESSISQIWALSGSFENGDLNTVEAGWKVDPGETYPRLFVYWTKDAYYKSGCYNLDCPGFVQTSRKIAVGAAFRPISSYGGKQYDIPILVFKDKKHGNWWLQVNGELVGYWPWKLFTHLKEFASVVVFGGEIINTESSGSHTTTGMGSGHFAQEGFKKASYFRNILLVDSSNILIPATGLTFKAEKPNCYNTKGVFYDKIWGFYFFYGGPGKNKNCP